MSNAEASNVGPGHPGGGDNPGQNTGPALNNPATGDEHMANTDGTEGPNAREQPTTRAPLVLRPLAGQLRGMKRKLPTYIDPTSLSFGTDNIGLPNVLVDNTNPENSRFRTARRNMAGLRTSGANFMPDVQNEARLWQARFKGNIPDTTVMFATVPPNVLRRIDKPLRGEQIEVPEHMRVRALPPLPDYKINPVPYTDTPDTVCGGCKQTGHSLRYCASPPREDGHMSGCPWCNTTRHYLDACPHRLAADVPELHRTLVQARAGLASFRSARDWLRLASEFPAEPVYPLTADYALRVGAATDYFQKWDYAQKRSTSALAEHLERDPLVASKDIILLALQNKTFDETFTEEKLVTARQAHQGSKRQKKASGENEATSIELRREIAKLQQQLDAKTATETPQVEVPRVEGMDIDQDGVNSVSTPLPEGEGENPAGGNNTAGRPQQLATTARRTRPLCNKHGHQKRQFDMD